jgi:hypothetical protein
MTRCVICRRAIVDHSIAEARACLAAIESIESMRYCRLTGPVAQRKEQRSPKARAAGSIPAGPTA